MSSMLHIFIVSNQPERCIAIEFDSGDDPDKPIAYDVKQVVWGTDREHDVPSLVSILYKRGWSLSEMDTALKRAREIRYAI